MAEERMRIKREISDLSAKADFPLRMLPLTSIRRSEELHDAMDEIESSDVILLYAAGGNEELLRQVLSHKPSVIFVRHRSGQSTCGMRSLIQYLYAEGQMRSLSPG